MHRRSPCISGRGCAHGGTNDVLVSSTLRDLVIGRDLSSKPEAITPLQGVPANGGLSAVGVIAAVGGNGWCA